MADPRQAHTKESRPSALHGLETFSSRLRATGYARNKGTRWLSHDAAFLASPRTLHCSIFPLPRRNELDVEVHHDRVFNYLALPVPEAGESLDRSSAALAPGIPYPSVSTSISRVSSPRRRPDLSPDSVQPSIAFGARWRPRPTIPKLQC